MPGQAGTGRLRLEGKGAVSGEQEVKSVALRPISVTAATLTLAEEDSGRTVVMDRAAGITVTLPRATGSGAVFNFFCKTTVTSNNNIIQVGNTDDVLQGLAQIAQDAADTVVQFETASTSDTMTMNGSTKGGIRGDMITIQDLESGLFSVNAFLSGTGTEATPFSAAV